MWLLLFLTSWFLKFSNLICQQMLVRFWFGRLHSICSFFGGRTSMATQRTHRELAPRYAAGKVPVPWGRECHWETRRPWLWSRHRSTCWVVVLGLWSFAAAKLCHERLKERQLNGAHSSMPPSCRCWTEMASQVSFDLTFWMMMPCGNFLLLRLQAIQCRSNMHASEYTMWLLLFLTSWFLKFSNLICQQLLVRFWFGFAVFEGAGQAWPRSGHTGSLLPDMLRGKVPVPFGRECHWETRRPWLWADIEAHAELWFLGFVLCSSKVMPWAFERTPTERGSLFPCLPPADVGQMASQVSLDLKFWMMMTCGSFLLLRLQTIQCQSNMHASEYTMWLLLFLTSWFLKFSNLICQQLLVRFWFGMLHCSCSFGGAGQAWPRSGHTGSLLQICCGESPRALGRECHWETRRPWLWSRHRSTCWVVVLCFGPLKQKVMPWAFERSQLNGLTLPCLPPFCWMQLWMQYFRWKMVY